MAVSHAFSNTVADWTGTVTVGNSAGDTMTIAATDLVRPTNWNSAHDQFYTLTGNTTQNSTASGTNVLISGGSNITIEGSASRIGIHGAGPPTLAFYDNMLVGNTATSSLVDMSLHVFPLQPGNEIMPGDISASSIFMNVSVGTISTAAAFTRSVSLGFYTSVNSSQLSLVFSASTTFGTGGGNMNINDSYNGPRWLTFNSNQFNNAPNFSANVRYWCGLWTRSSSGTASYSFYGMQTAAHSATRSGIVGAVSVNATSLGVGRLHGVYSVTFSTAMPDTIGASQLNRNVAAVQFIPQVILNNVGSNIV